MTDGQLPSPDQHLSVKCYHLDRGTSVQPESRGSERLSIDVVKVEEEETTPNTPVHIVHLLFLTSCIGDAKAPSYSVLCHFVLFTTTHIELDFLDANPIFAMGETAKAGTAI
jgi:hypothetical protein